MTGSVLTIDDDRALCELLSQTLASRGYQVEWATNARAGIDKAKCGTHDVVLTDLKLGRDVDGLQICAMLAESQPDVPIIVMTGFGSMETAVGAMRAGAYDFVTKPIDMAALELVLERAVRHRQLSAEVARLRREVRHSRRDESMIGESPAIRGVLELIARVADSDASVLVVGESGTGKELAARALHDGSSRSDGPFVAINCAAMPAQLLESELFGHTKGAFTDARGDRSGLFEQARGGTIFLDEIGEMGVELQPKLLRALQERMIRPVGANEEVPIDVRVVAATNSDLEKHVEEGSFRDDLYYRINVVTITMPPLRERGNDILLIAQRLLRSYAAAQNRDVSSLSRAAAERLLAYHWPGNVRELANCMERAVLLAQYSEIRVDDLPPNVRSPSSAPQIDRGGSAPILTLEEMERSHIERAVKVCDGNKTEAANLLGIDRSTLYRKMRRMEGRA